MNKPLFGATAGVDPTLVTNPMGVIPQSTQAPTAVPGVPARKPNQYYVPSNWDVQASGDDGVVCVNNATQDTFKGTMEEFNKLLRS